MPVDDADAATPIFSRKIGLFGTLGGRKMTPMRTFPTKLWSEVPTFWSRNLSLWDRAASPTLFPPKVDRNFQLLGHATSMATRQANDEIRASRCRCAMTTRCSLTTRCSRRRLCAKNRTFWRCWRPENCLECGRLFFSQVFLLQ